MDGSMFGVGYAHTTDTGAFVRVEGNYMSFDGASVSSANNNVITLNNLDGISAKVSLGNHSKFI